MSRVPTRSKQQLTPQRSQQKRFKIEYRYENDKLKNEILALHSYMRRMEDQYKIEVAQLKKQNKHFSHQILRLQEELSTGKEKNRKVERDDSILINLQTHVHHVQKQIQKRQQRELILLEDNQELRMTIQQLQGQIQRLNNQKQGLMKNLRILQSSMNLKQNQNKRVENMEKLMDELINTRNKIEQEIISSKNQIIKLKMQNQQLKKDCECLLELISSV